MYSLKRKVAYDIIIMSFNSEPGIIKIWEKVLLMVEDRLLNKIIVKLDSIDGKIDNLEARFDDLDIKVDKNTA